MRPRVPLSTHERGGRRHKARFRPERVTRLRHDAPKHGAVDARDGSIRFALLAVAFTMLLGAQSRAQAQPTVTPEATEASPEATTLREAAVEVEAPVLAPTVVQDPIVVAEPVPPAPTSATGDVRVHFEAGQGLQVTSNDGRFELIVRARAQFLASLRRPDGGDAGIDFELRRARIYFQGALFDPAIRFTLQLGVSPSCSDMGNNFAGNSCNGPSPATVTSLTGFTPRWSPLLDWYLELRHVRELNVRVGQMIPTFSRTFIISDSSYQFIDRSLEDGEFNMDRTFAIELRSTDVGGLGWLRYYAGVMSTQGRDMPFAADLHLGYYGRVDVNPLGFFNDYSQGDLARNVDPRLSLGFGYAYLDHAPFDRGSIGTQPLDSVNVGGSPNGTTDMQLLTADVVFMWQGFSFTGEWSMRQASRHRGTGIDPMTMMQYASPTLARTGYGMQALAGIMLGDLPLEIVARAGLVRRMGSWSDSSVTAAQSAMVDQNEAGGGINWYIQGHPLKLSLWFTDVWRDDGMNGTGQTLRLQLQATL